MEPLASTPDLGRDPGESKSGSGSDLNFKNAEAAGNGPQKQAPAKGNWATILGMVNGANSWADVRTDLLLAVTPTHSGRFCERIPGRPFPLSDWR